MQPPEHAEIFVTPITTSWWGEPGILYSVSLPGERTIENYSKVFELYARLSDNGKNKFCLLADISDTRPHTKEIREYITQETSKHIKAMALISYSQVGSATGSIFEMLSQTPYMVATFASRSEAIKWLQAQMANGFSPLNKA